MDTSKYTQNPTELTELATLALKQSMEEPKSIPYEEYKALETGFTEERKKLEDRMWLDSNMSKFDEVLRQNYDSSVRRFSENIITYIAKITGAVYGAFFVVEHEEKIVKATGGYACTIETMDRVKFNIGEGLIGQVAKSKEMLCLDDLETQLDSSLGRISASFLIVTPLVFNERVYGIIELTTLAKLKPRYLILIERMSRSVAAVLQSLINNQKTKQLLIDSLQQSEDFKAQKEEITAKEQEIHSLRLKLQLKDEELQNVLSRLNASGVGIAQENNEYIQQQLAEVRRESEYLRNQLDAKDRELKNLRSLGQRFQQLNEDIQDKTQQISQLNQLLADKETNLQIIQVELEQAKGGLSAIPEILPILTASTTEPGAEVKALQERLQKLEHELVEKIKEAEALQESIQWKDTEIARQDNSIDALKTRLEEEIAEKEAENKKNLEEIIRQEKALQQKEMEVEIFRKQFEETIQATGMSEELNQYKVLLNEKESIQAQLKDALEHERMRFVEQAASLQKVEVALAERQTEIETLKSQVAALSSEEPKVVADNAEMNRLQTSLQEKELQITQLKEALDNERLNATEQSESLNKVDAEIQSKEAEIHALKVQIKTTEQTPTATEEATRLQAFLQEKELQIIQLKEALDNERLNATEQSESLNKVDAEIQSKEAEIHALKTQIETAKQPTASGEEVTRLQAFLKEKELQFTQIKEALDNERLSYTEEHESLQKIEAELEQRNITLASQEVDLQQKSTLIAQLQAELAEIKEGFSQNQESFAGLRQELAQKDYTLQTAREELRLAETDRTQLSKEIEDLKVRLAKKEDELLVSQYMLSQAQSGTNNPGEIEILKAEIAQLRLALAKAESIEELISPDELENLRIHLVQKDGQIQALQAELEEKNEKTAPLENIEALALKLQKKDEVYHDLESRFNVQAETIELKKAESESLQIQLRQKEAEIEALKFNAKVNGDLGSAGEGIANLNIALEQKTEAMRLQTEALRSLKTELQEKEAEIARLSEELEDGESNSNEPGGERMSELVAELRQKEAENQQQSEELDRLHKLLLSLEGQLESAQKPAQNHQEPGMSVEQETLLMEKLAELEKIQEAVTKREEQLHEQFVALQQEQQNLLALKAESPQAVNEQETLISLKNQLEARQTELRQKEGELANLFNKINATFASMELDMQGNVLSINNKFLLNLGLGTSDVVGKSYDNLLLPDFVHSRDYKVLWEELKLGVSQTVEGLTCIGNKNKQVQVNATFIPVPGIDGRPYEVVKLVSLIINSEESKIDASKNQTTAEPNDSLNADPIAPQNNIEDQEKLSAIEKSFIVMELDTDGKIIRVNHQLSVFLGYEEDDLLGKPHQSIIDRDDQVREEYQDIIQNLNNGRFATDVLKYIGKEGEKLPLRSYFNPIHDQAGSTYKILVLSQFIH
jgi:PAS domain S-box-containing protein